VSDGLPSNPLVTRLARYVGVPSLSREEGPLCELVAGDLAQAGLRVERAGNNIWCTVGDAARPRLLLNTHLDTVPAGSGWSMDPFTLHRDDERLIGLGANDAKGAGVAMIAAMLAIKARLDAGELVGGTLVLALTAEEEISGQGLGTIRSQLGPLDAALVGEPTGLTPMIAQRGLLILRAVARGRTGHPANTPADTTDNAIVTAACDIAALRDFDWGPSHPLLGRCHAHVTKIVGGVALNVIPDECEFFIDIRTTPAESHAALFDRLIAAGLRSALHVRSNRLVPVETDAEAAIVHAVRRALPAARLAGSPAMSDMVFLEGVPSVKIGPGESSRSHTADEFIRVDELEAGAAAYEQIVRAYFALAGDAAGIDVRSRSGDRHSEKRNAAHRHSEKRSAEEST
jgi:acetylornithine deacetylase